MLEFLLKIKAALADISDEDDSASVHINDDGMVQVKVGIRQTRTMTLEEFAQWLT